jgi:hypothetical protein
VHVLPDPVLLEMASHHWDHRSRYAEPELGYASRAPEGTLRDTVDWLREHHPEFRRATAGPDAKGPIPDSPARLS